MSRLMSPLLLLTLIACTPSASARPDETSYRGLCDASAAVALGSEHFVVADDEDNVLTIYRLGKPDPTARIDLADYLGNRQASGKAREADLEGSTRIGQRIYWISSHGRTSKGKTAEPRQRFFATDIIDNSSAPGLRTTGTAPYSILLEKLIADRRFELLTRASALAISPKAAGGVNIEGLAATADGALLIGFRNPLREGLALLVPLTNPAAVIDHGASPLFGDAIWLDLGGRGIRSIESVAAGFLIVAGPFGKDQPSGKGFALYSWSGEATAAPKRLKDVDFGSWHPEALFAIAGRIYVLSDDGNQKTNGVPCKELPASRRSFRGRALE